MVLSFKDFQRIVNFDGQAVSLLDHFLQERESKLAQQIVSTLQPLFIEISAPTPAVPLQMKLSEVGEVIKKGISSLAAKDRNRLSPLLTMDQVIEQFNRALWSYAEVLESSSAELFQQVQQMPIDRWQFASFQVVSDLKELLTHSTEELLWTLKRLEQPLRSCLTDYFGVKKWFLGFGGNNVDKQLIQSLKNTDQFLHKHYSMFVYRYQKFSDLYASAEEKSKKLKGYPVLALLESKDYSLYLDVYKLLKLIELNRYPDKEVATDLVRALKYLSGMEQIVRLFRVYLNDCKEAFFKASLEWKSLDDKDEGFQQSVEQMNKKIQLYREELQQLLHTMSAYRSFLLKHDPNPYVRSRWGFTEWIVGQEPEKAKQLISLIYKSEELDELFQHLIKAIHEDSVAKVNREEIAKREIENYLHEMGQPLISRSMMHKLSTKLLDKLHILDEIGSHGNSSVSFMNKVFSLAIRHDWKYHVLHGFSTFHEMYLLHQGLVGYREDPSNAYRLEHFQRLFDQIEQWTVNNDIYSHIHEIELDVNDMKTYLQEFLAVVQRIEKDKERDLFVEQTVEKLSRQLLEYRYRFGQFFYRISSENADGRFLRNQFLFVDHYFESIENYIGEIGKK